MIKRESFSNDLVYKLSDENYKKLSGILTAEVGPRNLH
jgi:hypothetical protein